MVRRCLVLPLLCIPALALAQQPTSPEKPARELVAPEVLAAWEKAGAKLAGVEWNKTWHTPKMDLKQDAAAPPLFWFPEPKGVNFASLPDPGVPFGLYAPNIDNTAIDRIAKHKKLHLLLTSEGEWNATKTRQLAALTSLRTLKVAPKERAREVVAAIGKLKQLETLEIDFATVNPVPVPLTPLAGLKKLQHLKLTYMTHGPNAIRPLAGLTELRSLQVMCSLTDADVKQLAKLKKLTALDLGPAPKLTGESLKVIAGFPDLEWIILRHAGISDASLKNLGDLAKLDTLLISSTPITDAGLVHLQDLPKLRRVDLSYTKVTDAGLETLAGMPNLEFVELFGLKLSADAVKKLKKSLPRARVLSSVK